MLIMNILYKYKIIPGGSQAGEYLRMCRYSPFYSLSGTYGYYGEFKANKDPPKLCFKT